MTRRRTVGVLAGLIGVGVVLGSVCGIVTVAVALFVVELRNGRMVWPLTVFGSITGTLFGGGLGAILSPTIAFTRWRYLPIDRLFSVLTAGTIVGACVSFLVIPSPVVALLGGILGFLIAGDRLATRGPSPQPRGLTSSTTRGPANGR
jgi:hypothetical protein